jgi:hypothetical protein
VTTSFGSWELPILILSTQSNRRRERWGRRTTMGETKRSECFSHRRIGVFQLQQRTPGITVA